MTDFLDRDNLLMHLRRLEDKYGKELSNADFNFDDLVNSDPEDYRAILAFRKSIQDEGETKLGRKLKINRQQLNSLISQGLMKEEIAKKFQCAPSTIARAINRDEDLKKKYHELAKAHRITELSNVKQRNAKRRERVAIKISKIRFQHNMMMEQFAEAINKILGTTACSVGTVSNWERAVSLPNSKRLKAIAELGCVTVKELTGDD